MDDQGPNTPAEVVEHVAVAVNLMGIAFANAEETRAQFYEKGAPLDNVLVNEHTEQLIAVRDAIGRLSVAVSALAVLLQDSGPDAG